MSAATLHELRTAFISAHVCSHFVTSCGIFIPWLFFQNHVIYSESFFYFMYKMINNCKRNEGINFRRLLIKLFTSVRNKTAQEVSPADDVERPDIGLVWDFSLAPRHVLEAGAFGLLRGVNYPQVPDSNSDILSVFFINPWSCWKFTGGIYFLLHWYVSVART